MDLNFYNNLLLDVGGLISNSLYFDLRSSASLDGNSDNNYAFSLVNDWTSWNLVDGQTLTEWQSLSGNDASSRILDPELISVDPSSNEFGKLSSSSSLINNSYNLNDSILDFYGNLRDSNHDIGAVEYI